MIRRTLAAAALLSVLGLTGSAAQAADPHIDEAAVAVRNTAAQICNELRFHYRGSAYFSHLYNDAYQMYATADHVHEVAHFSNNLVHLRNDVAQLDALFHHFEEMVDLLNAEYGFHPGVGVDPWGHGHSGFHGGHTNRLNRLVSTLSAQLHHLQADVDSVVAAPVPVVPYSTPGYPVQTFPKKANKGIWLNKNGNGFGISIAIP